jgi:hypothetical protein
MSGNAKFRFLLAPIVTAIFINGCEGSPMETRMMNILRIYFKTKTYIAIALLIIGIVILSSCSKEPDNFNDCILKHIKGSQTEDAVFLIEQACETKFPRSPKQK